MALPFSYHQDLTSSPMCRCPSRWHRVAMTAEVTGEKQREIKLYRDGELVNQAFTENALVPLSCPDSIILGTELHYMHCN